MEREKLKLYDYLIMIETYRDYIKHPDFNV